MRTHSRVPYDDEAGGPTNGCRHRLLSGESGHTASTRRAHREAPGTIRLVADSAHVLGDLCVTRGCRRRNLVVHPREPERASPAWRSSTVDSTSAASGSRLNRG